MKEFLSNPVVSTSLILIGMLLAAWLSYVVAKFVGTKCAFKFTQKTKNTWDDVFHDMGLFRRAAMLVPIVIIYFCSEMLLSEYPQVLETVLSFCKVTIVVISAVISFVFLDAVNEIYSRYDISTKTPIKSFLQIIKIVVFVIAAVCVISSLINHSPWALLKAMGALTAVLMLIFKDTILGFVASVQLAGQKMVRIGDWIEMPKYGADGDVIDISLTTIKVQNWDKTISCLPTYSLVSDSFKNWRGMAESGGRRIKRSFNLDMNSFTFCDAEMIERFKEIEHISSYIDERANEINKHNEKNEVNTANKINGRRMTNIGTFRHYVKQYLRNHAELNHDMTFLIRQLEPTESGLPIQVYVFTKDTAWVNHEEVQADIFDHILTVIPEFDLKIFQSPSGNDFQNFLRAD